MIQCFNNETLTTRSYTFISKAIIEYASFFCSVRFCKKTMFLFQKLKDLKKKKKIKDAPETFQEPSDMKLKIQ